MTTQDLLKISLRRLYSASTTVVWRFWMKKRIAKGLEQRLKTVCTLNDVTSTWLA
jgi:hypothetical protein